MHKNEQIKERLFRWINTTATAKGLTDRAWSMKATNSPDTIRNIRRGKSVNPTVATLERLASAAGVSIDALITSPAPEKGTYWIRLSPNGGWHVAEHDGENWWLCGSDIPFSRRGVVKVGPKVFPPEPPNA